MSLELSELELEAIYQVFNRLEQRWVTPGFGDPRFWEWEGLPMAEFLRGTQEAEKRTSGRRFIDVGCGIGIKLSFMHHLGWDVTGIDHHQPYLEAAQELIPEATLIHADLREVQSYDYDLVYMYHPAIKDDLELELEHHVVERMKSGNILFLPGRYTEFEGMSHNYPYIWVKE